MKYINDNPPQEENRGFDMETLSQLCSHASQEATYENMRHIKNVISKTKIENPFSIQPVETFGQSALQLHLYKREILDQKNTDKTTKQAPGLNDGVWLNDNTPLQSRAQYPTKNATANAALIQETEDTESKE